MPSKRKISAAEFVKDLRSGMTLSELMNKYSIVPRELDSIFAQLKQSLVSPLELYGRSLDEQAGTATEKIRFFRRHQVGLQVRIYDASDKEIWGYVKDVSERGVGIQGIEAGIDETKTLVIASDEFFAINQIKLVAKCRWFKATGAAGKFLGGFEIIDISERDFERLKRFIEVCARSEQASNVPARSDSVQVRASSTANTETVWVCPFCKKPQSKEYEECPQCGIIAKKYMQRLEKTKSEIVSIMEKEVPAELTKTSQKQRPEGKTVSIPVNLWTDLESLGGDTYEHFINALSTYVLRQKVGGQPSKAKPL